MDRDIRIFNRPIMQKIFRKNQELHLKRLKNIRSVINGKNTVGNSHPISNKKAQQIEEDKKTEIEKQNAILFNRMMRIMKRDDKNNQGTYSTIAGSSSRPRNSLDYSRINQQNRSLFERLQSQKPTISNKKLQNERRKNLTLLKFMGKYPNQEALKYQSIELGSRGHFHQSNKSQHKRFSSTKEQYYKSSYNEQEDPQFLISMREEEFRRLGNSTNKNTENNKNETRQRYYPSRNLDTSANKRKFMSQSINRRPQEKNNTIESDEQILKGQQVEAEVDLPTKPNEQGKNQNQDNHNNAKNPSITLYQTVQNINGRDMAFKIIRHYSKYQITAEPLLKQFTGQVYSIQLTEVEGTQFFVSHDYNFQSVAKLIQIQNGKLTVKSDKIRLKGLQKGSFEISEQQKSQVNKKKMQTKQKQKVSQSSSQVQKQQKLEKSQQIERNPSQQIQPNGQNKAKVQIYEEALQQLVQ